MKVVPIQTNNSLMKQQITDLKVFSHHIYEYKKGLRNLVLTTEKSMHQQTIENRLKKENIDYVVQNVDESKINVYFGAKECVDVVKTFVQKTLSALTPEQDFILGIMLGYDKIQECVRYLKLLGKENDKVAK